MVHYHPPWKTTCSNLLHGHGLKHARSWLIRSTHVCWMRCVHRLRRAASTSTRKKSVDRSAGLMTRGKRPLNQAAERQGEQGQGLY